ncbi:transcriptional regulator [Kitasatospora griseola]|uniref:Transcriptional regulator n=1 Tax=Kitasatospora griseola TaxID=2064 RepID=A0A0D0NG13_KITGR|nr:MerR family transcriptional regulator [Kitasatospora griseola]KIQ67245.1 transcriptional regulator [Kitasatospora griseola]
MRDHARAADGASDGAGLPTGAVARRLGVSPTTIRSWERRYGIGPAGRRPGHHRRWSPADIAVLEAMCRLTARGVPPAEAARAVLAAGPPARPPAPAAGGPGGSRALHVGSVRPECRGLARAAVRLDSPEVARILQDAVAALGTVEAWTEVMLPALRAVGRKWASDGEQYVEVEHLLSWHVSTALRTAAVRPTALRAVPPVLLAAMPAEQHTLPLDAVAAGLTERTLPFRMLGAAVPPRALLDAVRRTGPGAVMLWSQSPQTSEPELVRQVVRTAWGARGSRSHAIVLATGPGWHRFDPPEGAAGPRTLLGALDLLERTVTA